MEGAMSEASGKTRLENTPFFKAEGPVLIFGGPYSNLQATKAVLSEASRLGIPPCHIVCTGDLVAYCGSPVETVALIREAGIRAVMGNCDEQLALDADDCGCGFSPGSACDRLSAAWFTFARQKIEALDREWLTQLPRRIDIGIGGRRLAIVHGTVSEINRFVFASSDMTLKRAEIALSGCDGIVAGHSGLPFTQVIGDKLWHNAGAIGMPANDGTCRTWYSILMPGKGGLRIEVRPLSYDYRAAQRAMIEAGLPPDYRDALETGLWPSCDVLLEAELEQRGRPLRPDTVEWLSEESVA
jgi:predicted phosphodiesterase